MWRRSEIFEIEAEPERSGETYYCTSEPGAKATTKSSEIYGRRPRKVGRS